MTLFISGIHGAGKTYLAKPAAQILKLRYATASQLIREERGRVTWDAGKFVNDVAMNQRALVTAVTRISAAGEKLLLDGHFVLRTAVSEHERLPQSVFQELGCTAVLLLQCSLATISDRLSKRGDESWTESELASFEVAEIDHATSICGQLGIPLRTLYEPTLDVFIDEARDLLSA